MMRIYKRRHIFRMILALCCFVKSFPYVHNVYLQIAIYCRYLLYHLLLLINKIGAARLCSVVAGAASSRALPSAAPVSFQPKTQSAMATTRNDKTRKISCAHIWEDAFSKHKNTGSKRNTLD